MTTKQNTAAQLNVEQLRQIVKQVPKCKEVMQFIANSRDRSREQTSFLTLRRQPEMRKIELDMDDMHRIFDALQSCGAGIKSRSTGRKTDYLLFRWQYNMQDIASAALGRKLPEGRFRPPVYALERFEKMKQEEAARAAVVINMQKSSNKGTSETSTPTAIPNGLVQDVPTADGDIVRIRMQAFGRLVEAELDLSKIPNEAYRNMRVL